ncbi:MAG: hypothetical protein K9G76_12440 [Bacteroidales bacterium]|nr:hypothetical protein [Bacteroidales bacterium]MCF8405338.1 hypothetical protein [Bacteroidales bacterium]
MNSNLLKYLIYFSGILCLYAFIAVRLLPLFNFALIEERRPDYFEFMKYGELYYFSQIDHFKENLPFPEYKYRLSEKNPTLEESDIIAFGDSFFDINRQKTVAERLHDSLGLKVHAASGWFPLEYLAQNRYKTGKEKTIIFQIVERNIDYRFRGPHKIPIISQKESGMSMRKLAAGVKDKIFLNSSEELYNVLLKGSYPSNLLYSKIATLKFDAFGYISSQTPVYDLQTYSYPLLFYYLTVNDNHTSFYYEHTDEMIKNYCDNLVDLSIKLKENYNLNLIFLPVPNKFTIYYKDIRQDDVYDNLLPRLYAEMAKRPLTYINIYDDFVSSDKQLFYGTDTHWNKNGVDLAVKRLLELFNE